MTRTNSSILIIGGGTAGWLTAAFLARRLGTGRPGGVAITLVESPNVPSVGVGEGTLPSLRLTLATLGVDEAEFMRDCDATFKQGIHFSGWTHDAAGAPQEYFHPFNSPRQMGGIELAPYWLMGCADDAAPYAAAVTPQYDAYRMQRAPKRLADAPFSGPLNYAYHLDVHKLADFLKRYATGLGVTHRLDHVRTVEQTPDGTIAAVTAEQAGRLEADLYIDCTGFRGRLIGEALGEDLKPVSDTLFCDRAVALQVPYGTPDHPLRSVTVSTAHEAGWTWDIGLTGRRGVGYVYSSAHAGEDEAVATLKRYIGPDAEALEPRHLTMTTGYRPVQWKANCVAVGLSAGFLEPLESTGILFIEAAAHLIADLWPSAGSFAPAARQFNRAMSARMSAAVDFLKLHYCLNNREDTAFWRDNRAAAGIPDSLAEKLELWRYKLPGQYDLDTVHESFRHINYAYILLGMGAGPDLRAETARHPHTLEAKREFARIREAARRAVDALPDHRALIEAIRTQGFAQTTPQSMGGAA